MVTMSWMSPMPSSLMSSSRPMKGLTHQAPALAARRAWLGEKHSVTLTLIPSDASALQAFKPSGISGTLTMMFLWILARSLPSLIMASASTLTTSALTGPSTIEQISWRRSLKLRPSLATSDGLVVTPSRMPQLAASLISFALPVSKKIIIGNLQVKETRFARVLYGILGEHRGLCKQEPCSLHPEPRGAICLG